ncbi:MAG: putative poly(aspartic acid) hydrolase [Sphingomonas bacterium]|nr:M20/M25/M40 family metallo-hydrolase [Sphingomonas bacterium]MDB5689620.1 putative poly(aspartic acid) hydrolase [Sphingomonas bacterium]
MLRRTLRFTVAALALAAGGGTAIAQAAPAGETASGPVIARMTKLMKSPAFAKASASLEGDWERIVADVITLTEIPAPPFKEAERAKAYAAMLKDVGLADVEIDTEGNATGLRRGTDPKAPLIVIAAHLDTVFPEGTDTKVRREGNRLSAPGIGDDTCSLAVLLAFVRALDRAGIKTKNDILFVGNVGEEGPGDLRGVRYLFNKSKHKDRIGSFISFEPGQGRVTNGGVGSRRYRVNFHGPGGHSFGAFGLVNPAQAMANAIVAFGQMKVPAQPKTTFNVGIVEGGTSVNSIPHDVAMTVDMRSENKAQLEAEVDYLMAALPKAVALENATRSTASGPITFEAKQIGDRAVGMTAPDAEIVQLATAAMNVRGVKPSYGFGSTDSNVPMGLGIPAVTLGSGFKTQRSHALDESLLLDKPSTVSAMQMGLATVIALAKGD